MHARTELCLYWRGAYIRNIKYNVTNKATTC